MSHKSKEIFDEFATEAKYLWNSSDLDDNIIYSGVEAIERFKKRLFENVDFDKMPETMARQAGFNLIETTTKMILSIYDGESPF